MKKLLFVSLVSCLFTGASFAAAYGTAGCGLGSQWFGGDKGFNQVWAATTNGSSGNQTFGITSGTSNCDDGGKSAVHFIEANKTSLKNDVATGRGETISSLSKIYNCSSVEFGTNLQRNYDRIFSTEDSKHIAIEVLAVSKQTCQG